MMKPLKILIIVLLLTSCASVNKTVPLPLAALHSNNPHTIPLPAAGNIRLAGRLQQATPYSFIELNFNGIRGQALNVVISAKPQMTGYDIKSAYAASWTETLHDYWQPATIPSTDMDIAIQWHGNEFSVTINNITRQYKTSIWPRELNAVIYGGKFILEEGTTL